MGSRWSRGRGTLFVASIVVVVLLISAAAIHSPTDDVTVETAGADPIDAPPINHALTDGAAAEAESYLKAYLQAVNLQKFYDGVTARVEAERQAAAAAEAARQEAAAKAAAAQKAQQQKQQQQQRAAAPQSSGGTVDGSGLDSFMRCVMQRESGGNPRAKNPSGAAGLFQFMPQTARTVAGWMGRPDLGSDASQWSVADQIRGALLLYERSGRSPWAAPAGVKQC